MAMVAGTVAVDNGGNITYTPNDGTNMAKAKFVAAKTIADAAWDAQGDTTPVEALQALADDANAFAAWFVPYMQANAQAKIADDSSADGLQQGTTHPNNPKFLPIV